MTWQQFVDWLNPFIYGLVIGYAWNPIWKIIKKVWHEAKIAKEQWRNPK